MSLDVFITGPNDSIELPLGEQQYLKAGLVDEIQIHLIPILLGEGIRLFEYLGTEPVELERTRLIQSSDVTHLRFRIIK